MDDNVMRVLQLLQENKITAQEAESLISALTARPAAPASPPQPAPPPPPFTAVPEGPRAEIPRPETPEASDYKPSGLPTGELLQQIADDPSIPEHDKLTIIINATSLLCSLLVIQPIPLADLVILTPVQVAGVFAMSQVMGEPLGKNGAGELVASIAAVVGGGILAQQLMYAGVKTFVPIFGGIAIIPVVYAATYGLMTASRAVLDARRTNQHLSDEEIRRIKEEAERRAKNEKRDWSPTALKRDLDAWRVKGEAYKQYETLIQDEQRRIQNLHDDVDTLTAQMVNLSQQKMDLEQQVQTTGDRLNGQLSEDERGRLQAENEQARRELERINPLWTSKGAELEQKRSEVEQIFQKIEGILRERYERSYSNILFAPHVLSDLAATPYGTLHAIERQISLLQYEPMKVNFQNEPFTDAAGQEVRIIAVDSETRLYATTQGNRVFVRAVGSRATEDRDVGRLRDSRL